MTCERRDTRGSSSRGTVPFDSGQSHSAQQPHPLDGHAAIAVGETGATVAHRGQVPFSELVDQAAELAAATEAVIAACGRGGDPGPEPARAGSELFSAYDDIRRRVRAYPSEDRVKELAELLVRAEGLLGLALESAYGPIGNSAGHVAAGLDVGSDLVAQFLALKAMPVRCPRS